LRTNNKTEMSIDMKHRPARQKLSRRNFLMLIAAAGVTAAGGYVLYEYTPWLNYDQQALQTRRPLERAFLFQRKCENLCVMLRLQRSGHNTQPWKFAIQENAIEIHPDLTGGCQPWTRRARVMDQPGCALENLLVAARAGGYAPVVTYPGQRISSRSGLTADSPQAGPLFDAIPLRQNTRSESMAKPLRRVTWISAGFISDQGSDCVLSQPLPT